MDDRILARRSTRICSKERSGGSSNIELNQLIRRPTFLKQLGHRNPLIGTRRHMLNSRSGSAESLQKRDLCGPTFREDLRTSPRARKRPAVRRCVFVQIVANRCVVDGHRRRTPSRVHADIGAVEHSLIRTSSVCPTSMPRCVPCMPSHRPRGRCPL